MVLLPEPLQMVMDHFFNTRHQLTSWTVTPGVDGVSSTLHIHWRRNSNHHLLPDPWLDNRNTGFLGTGDSEVGDHGGLSSSEEATTAVTTEVDTGGDTGHGTSVRSASLDTSSSLVTQERGNDLDQMRSVTGSNVGLPSDLEIARSIDGTDQELIDLMDGGYSDLDLMGSVARSNDDLEMSRSRLVDISKSHELRDLMHIENSDLGLNGALTRSNNVMSRSEDVGATNEVKGKATGAPLLTLLTQEEWLGVYECGRLREQMRRVREAILHLEEAAYVRHSHGDDIVPETETNHPETETKTETNPEIEIENRSEIVAVTETEGNNAQPENEIENEIDIQIETNHEIESKSQPEIEINSLTPLATSTKPIGAPPSPTQSVSDPHHTWTAAMFAAGPKEDNGDLLMMKPDPASPPEEDSRDTGSASHRPQVCVGSEGVTGNYGNCLPLGDTVDGDSVCETADVDKEEFQVLREKRLVLCDAESKLNNGGENNGQIYGMANDCSEKAQVHYRIEKGTVHGCSNKIAMYGKDDKSPVYEGGITDNSEKEAAHGFDNKRTPVYDFNANMGLGQHYQGPDDEASPVFIYRDMGVQGHKYKPALTNYSDNSITNGLGYHITAQAITTNNKVTGQCQLRTRSRLGGSSDLQSPVRSVIVGNTQSDQRAAAVAGVAVGIGPSIDPLGGTSSSRNRQHSCGGGLLSETPPLALYADGRHVTQHVTNHMACMGESRDSRGQNGAGTKLDIPNGVLIDSSCENKLTPSKSSEKQGHHKGIWKCEDGTQRPKHGEFQGNSKRECRYNEHFPRQNDIGDEASNQRQVSSSSNLEYRYPPTRVFEFANLPITPKANRDINTKSTAGKCKGSGARQQEELLSTNETSKAGIVTTHKHRECQCRTAFNNMSSIGVSQQNELDMGEGVLMRSRVEGIWGGRGRGLTYKLEAESTQSSLSYQDSDEELLNYMPSTTRPVAVRAATIATGLTNGRPQMGLQLSTGQSGTPIHTGTSCNVGADWWVEEGEGSVGFSEDISRFTRPEGQQANKSCQTSLINPIRQPDRNVHSRVDSNANGMSQYSRQWHRVDSNTNRPSSTEIDMEANLSLLCSTPITSLNNLHNTQPHCEPSGASLGQRSSIINKGARMNNCRLQSTPMMASNNLHKTGKPSFLEQVGARLSLGDSPEFQDGTESTVTDSSQEALLTPSLEWEENYQNVNITGQYSPLNDLSPSIRGEISRTNRAPTSDITLHTDTRSIHTVHTDTRSLNQDQPIYWDLLVNIRQHQGRLVFSKVVVDWSSIKALRAQVGELCVLYLVSAKLCQFVTPRFGWEYQKHCDVISRSQPISEQRVMDNRADVWYATEVRDMTEQTVEHVMRMSETISCLTALRKD